MKNGPLKIILIIMILATIIVLATNLNALPVEVIVLLTASIFLYIGLIIFVDATDQIKEDHDNLYNDVNKLKLRLDEINEKKEDNEQ